MFGNWTLSTGGPILYYLFDITNLEDDVQSVEIFGMVPYGSLNPPAQKRSNNPKLFGEKNYRWSTWKTHHFHWQL